MWDVSENEQGDIPTVEVLSYQDEECGHAHVQLDEGRNQPNDQAANADCDLVDAAVVDDLHGEREGED